jgi:LacI family transcriptional regulator
MSNREFLHSFHARILKGVETCARSLGQQVVFAVIHYGEKTPPGQIVLPPILKERGWVDGLVLAGTIYPNFVEHIKSIHVPYVMFGNNLFGPKHMLKYDQVSFDGEKAEFEATQFVIKQGHREIAFVGETSFPWFRERHAGYRRALRTAGLNPLVLNSQPGNGSSDYAEWAAHQLLQLNPRPTAVMAGNDEIAYGLWRSLRKSGMCVPDDISLVGFDDRDIALLMDPPLTTVRVHKEEIGEALMKMLLDKLHHPANHFARQEIPTQLIVRDTVKPFISNPLPVPQLAHSANI